MEEMVVSDHVVNGREPKEALWQPEIAQVPRQGFPSRHHPIEVEAHPEWKGGHGLPQAVVVEAVSHRRERQHQAMGWLLRE